MMTALLYLLWLILFAPNKASALVHVLIYMIGSWWLTWCLSINDYLSILSFYAKYCQACPTYISLAWSLLSLYFWFLTDKSSWVHSRTQGLFPLVASCDVSWLLQELDGSCRSGEVWSWAWSFWVILSLMLLLEVDLNTSMYLKQE
jgi:hypothetical protein